MSGDQEIKEYILGNSGLFECDDSEAEKVRGLNQEIREAEKLRELLLPQKKPSSVKRDSSTLKEMRVSLKD